MNYDLRPGILVKTPDHLLVAQIVTFGARHKDVFAACCLQSTGNGGPQETRSAGNNDPFVSPETHFYALTILPLIAQDKCKRFFTQPSNSSRGCTCQGIVPIQIGPGFAFQIESPPR